MSEIGCTIANATVDLINLIFNSDFSTGYTGSYNFENPHVYFAENYAEWYSLVGCYGKGILFKDIEKGSGEIIGSTKIFKNQNIFSVIIKLLKNCGYENSSDIIVSIIDKYNVTTFKELYMSLIKEFPSLKTEIDKAFIDNYNSPNGTKDGYRLIN